MKYQHYVLQKGVPMPDASRKLGISGLLRSMEVDDSFTAPIGKKHSIAALASKVSTATGAVFRILDMSDTVCGVWRVK